MLYRATFESSVQVARPITRTAKIIFLCTYFPPYLLEWAKASRTRLIKRLIRSIRNNIAFERDKFFPPKFSLPSSFLHGSSGRSFLYFRSLREITKNINVSRVYHRYTGTLCAWTIVQTIGSAVSYMIVACRYYAEQPYTSYCLALLTNRPIDFHPPNFPHV